MCIKRGRPEGITLPPQHVSREYYIYPTPPPILSRFVTNITKLY